MGWFETGKPFMRIASNNLLTLLDLAGTLVFAIEGAMIAIEGNLDLLGVLVLAFATALGGGMARDVLIGATPPEALRDWRYPSMALIGGLLAFTAHQLVQAVPNMVIIDLDAAGLALFAVAGTEKTLRLKLPAFVAILMGAITAVGGGVVRDVLLTHVPAVLRIDVYATAALAGSASMVAGRWASMSPRATAAIGIVVCFGLRIVSVWQHWNLPRAIDYQW
jgi:uncharacterized membrane protein YeiH